MGPMAIGGIGATVTAIERQMDHPAAAEWEQP